jgi:poly-gamma-glutamate capsule biosynthesis protein CapA/YwtB (metallophosphatase superfamily)
MAPRTYTLNFMGDTMLGRLIDQMFPQHVDEPSEARIAKSFLSSHPKLKDYIEKSPWGDTLPLLHEADLNILNLETSATTSSRKWPDKMFNYRMHPANIKALQAAKIDYAGLAKNHTLDFCEEGLIDTVRTVRDAGINFAGSGESRDEATRPSILCLPANDANRSYEIHVWAAADHPHDWAKVPTFHFIDYTQATRDRLQKLLNRPTGRRPALKVFSVHWGPNYSWQPADKIRELAYFLVNSCGIDIVHGHSSHHVQGVEKYKGKLIIYGCGDFVDDYALVEEYRNDLSGVWRVTVEETEDVEKEEGLNLKSLEVFPTKIDKFMARRLRKDETDCEWVRKKVRDLSAGLGTNVDVQSSSDGSVILDLT